MNRKAMQTIDPWALLGIGVMVCLTLIAIVAIFTRSAPISAQDVGRVPLAQAGAQPQDTAAIVEQPLLDDAPIGHTCGSGGCGCGGG